jgi:hypothetical protein
MTQREPTAAEAIFPHLKRAQISTPNEPRRNVPTSDLARAMYPNHVPPKPKPPPRPVRSIEEIRRDFSNNMDPEFARMIGFRKLEP